MSRAQTTLTQPMLFNATRPVRRPKRTAQQTALFREFTYFRDRYIEVRKAPLFRVSMADDLRAIKRLQALVPEEPVRHAIYDIWVEDSSPFVVSQGHLLRYLLVEWRLQPALRQAEARVRAQAPLPRVIAAPPDLRPVPVPPAAASEALAAARLRAYRRRHGESGT